MNVGILFLPVHHLLRVGLTSEKHGGKLTEEIKIHIQRKQSYISLNQNIRVYYTPPQIEQIITIDTEEAL